MSVDTVEATEPAGNDTEDGGFDGTNEPDDNDNDTGGAGPTAAAGGPEELNPDAVRVAQTGRIYTAPPGTAVPDLTTIGPDVPWPAPWEPMGLATEDGVEHELSDDVEEVMSWQRDVVRIISKKRDISVKFAALETRKETVEQYYGAKFEKSGTTAKMGIRAQAVRPPRALGWEWTDGETVDGNPATWRMGIPRGQVSEVESPKFKKGEAVVWGFTFKTLGGTAVYKAEWYTNDKRILDALDGKVRKVPGPPTAVAATEVKETSAKLTWTKPSNPDATGYQVYDTTDGRPGVPKGGKLGDVAETTLTGLEANTRYVFAVTAFNADGRSALSADVPVKTKTALAAPTVSIPANNATGVDPDAAVSGSGVTGAKVDLYHHTAATGAGTKCGTANVTGGAWSVATMNPKPGKGDVKYLYAVQVKDGQTSPESPRNKATFKSS